MRQHQKRLQSRHKKQLKNKISFNKKTAKAVFLLKRSPHSDMIGRLDKNHARVAKLADALP